MSKRNIFICMSLMLAILALVIGFEQTLALAYSPPNASVPTCTVGGPSPCTDYFGVANYANSPLPAGTITGFIVTSGGSGYSATPTVSITDPACSATATATVSGGVITAVTVASGGTGCIAPQVMIADASGTGAWLRRQ